MVLSEKRKGEGMASIRGRKRGREREDLVRGKEV